MSFAITDSPVSDAQNVVVSFDGMELQSSSSGRITFMFNKVKQIDLLQLQGNEFDSLLNDATVPSGQYQWLVCLFWPSREMIRIPTLS